MVGGNQVEEGLRVLANLPKQWEQALPFLAFVVVPPVVDVELCLFHISQPNVQLICKLC